MPKTFTELCEEYLELSKTCVIKADETDECLKFSRKKWYSGGEVKEMIDKLIQTGVIEDKRG